MPGPGLCSPPARDSKKYRMIYRFGTPSMTKRSQRASQAHRHGAHKPNRVMPLLGESQRLFGGTRRPTLARCPKGVVSRGTTRPLPTDARVGGEPLLSRALPVAAQSWPPPTRVGGEPLLSRALPVAAQSWPPPTQGRWGAVAQPSVACSCPVMASTDAGSVGNRYPGLTANLSCGDRRATFRPWPRRGRCERSPRGRQRGRRCFFVTVFQSLLPRQGPSTFSPIVPRFSS